MNNALFAVFELPDEIEDVQSQDMYKLAPLWDFESGEFVLNGARQPVYGTGYDAWVLWCSKAILTQRWAHFAYSGNSGIEAREAFSEPDRQSQESALERTITEALLADPLERTQQVKDFRFLWGVDSLEINCVIVGNEGNSAAIKVRKGDLF
ncbi:MAG: DUF2634 domain-containing protein [Oscillospiraceae bacterium]|nr:DUF2634 domain-containing protein [Oscillospiraceae bacterium]